MSYRVICDCGRETPVSSGQAGSQIACLCGRAIQVPTLSQLARACGNPLAGLSPAERVRYLVSAGQLPPAGVCMRCQFPTETMLACSVECERPYVNDRHRWWDVIFAVVSVGVLFRSMMHSSEQGEVHGRELIIKTPLRMCVDCQQRYPSGAHASEVRELLRGVPEYDELLQAYPQAAVAAMPLRQSTR